MSASSQHYQQIAEAINYFRCHQDQQPNLETIARHVGISSFHFQRLFSEWVGVSPKKFLQYLTKEKAKQHLRNSSLMSVALDVGLSGTGRLHDLMISCEGVTPGEYKRWGEGLQIHYGLHASPFGLCLLAITDRGVCKCAFYDSEEQALQLIEELHADWPGAEIIRADECTAGLVARIFPNNASEQSLSAPGRLHLLLKGSQFQLQVWEALLRVPEGELLSYQQLAQQAGKVRATRAVASAVAHNNLAYLIPCHRVIRSNGEFNEYRWGATRKLVMIGWEACQCEHDADERAKAL